VDQIPSFTWVAFSSQYFKFNLIVVDCTITPSFVTPVVQTYNINPSALQTVTIGTPVYSIGPSECLSLSRSISLVRVDTNTAIPSEFVFSEALSNLSIGTINESLHGVYNLKVIATYGPLAPETKVYINDAFNLTLTLLCTITSYTVSPTAIADVNHYLEASAYSATLVNLPYFTSNCLTHPEVAEVVDVATGTAPSWAYVDVTSYQVVIDTQDTVIAGSY